MFNRINSVPPVTSAPVVIKRQVEVPSSNGVDVVYTDKEEPLPPYDSYSVEALTSAGVPLKAVNPAILDNVDLSAVSDFVSRETSKTQPTDNQPVSQVDENPVNNPNE